MNVRPTIQEQLTLRRYLERYAETIVQDINVECFNEFETVIVVPVYDESDADLEDFVAVLCPATYASLFKLDDFARYDVIGNSLGTELPRVSGFVGKLGGVDVVVSNNFRNKDNSAYLTSPVFNKADGTTDESDQLAGFLIKKDAIKIAYASGMKARVQSDYSLTTLSTQFVADSVYGCTIVGDNSTNKTVFALCDA